MTIKEALQELEEAYSYTTEELNYIEELMSGLWSMELLRDVRKDFEKGNAKGDYWDLLVDTIDEKMTPKIEAER